ncbi:ATP-binding cassette subfamily B protein [Treponema rectale]|uniref:ATP-binding cassette subfamily B protein n=1 Tax=Treponema rectale TaxID=744512 RepID=A0A840SFE3_9SPIR|nr:ABC transporter ATP-binding protein [Treponema rectale]MBB5219455.1 ATP-binding cassette subfamily B protein [Treponema rectale]
MPPVKMRGTGKPENTSGTVRRLFKYASDSKFLFIIVLISVIFSAGAQVAGDSLLKPAVNNYIIPLYEKFSSGQSLCFKDFIPFIKLIMIMCSIFAAGVLGTWVNARIMIHIATKLLFKIRTELFHKMETLPLKFYDFTAHGNIMSLYTNDIDTLRDMLSQTVPQLFSGLLSVSGVFIMMLTVSPLLTFIMVVTVFCMLMIAGEVGKRSAKSFRQQQENIGKLNGFIEEMIEGQRVIKVFNREGHAEADFAKLNDALCEAGTRANTYGNLFGPVMGNLSHVQYAVIAITGAFLVIKGKMDLGSIAAFLQYTRSFSRPVSMMSQQFNSILNALAGAERIFKVIDEPGERDDGTVTLVNAVETSPAADAEGKSKLVESFAFTGEWAWKSDSLIQLKGDVEFKDVSFSYVPEKEILHGINIHARPGQKIALVGSTGSGKTTVTNLLTRFYDIDDAKGMITYDGIPLKQISKDALRSSLGMVLQDTHLFTGTIRDNIRYGNLEASEKQIIDAAKLANAHEFIIHLEKGYDTVISGDGGNLSQGQRQLLSIARAAVADPPVLILDEATSSIDTRTEHLIEIGMDRLMEGRTVFVIAHRLSTVRNADEIIVLEHGTVVERGNHQELMQMQGRYYNLYTGKFELD